MNTVDTNACAPPKFDKTERNSTLYLFSNTNHTLSCRIQKEDPICGSNCTNTITWYFNETELEISWMGKKVPTFSIVLQNVSLNHRGKYACVVKNCAGEDRKIFTIFIENSVYTTPKLDLLEVTGYNDSSYEMVDVFLEYIIKLDCIVYVSSSQPIISESDIIRSIKWQFSSRTGYNTTLNPRHDQRVSINVTSKPCAVVLPRPKRAKSNYTDLCFVSQLMIRPANAVIDTGVYSCHASRHISPSHSANPLQKHRNYIVEYEQSLKMTHLSEHIFVNNAPLHLDFIHNVSNICTGRSFPLTCSTTNLASTVIIARVLSKFPSIQLSNDSLILTKASFVSSLGPEKNPRHFNAQQDESRIVAQHILVDPKVEDSGYYACIGLYNMDNLPVFVFSHISFIHCSRKPNDQTTAYFAALLSFLFLATFVLLTLLAVWYLRRKYPVHLTRKRISILIRDMVQQSAVPEKPPPTAVRPPDVVVTHIVTQSSHHQKGDVYLRPTRQRVALKNSEFTQVGLHRGKCLYHLPLDENWEIPKGDLTLFQRLGEGAFGIVYAGRLRKSIGEDGSKFDHIPVAVKMLRDNFTEDDLVEFVKEMEVMKLLGSHPNVIQLIGTCTRNGPLLVVVEYAPYNNLLHYLRSRRHFYQPESPGTGRLSLNHLYQFALDVASGMNYLSSKSIIHRDLAARNCLVGENYTIKICDFGLSRTVSDYYRKKTPGRVPLKWLAPESLSRNIYTTQTDVWSFGVLLYEIFTLGGAPYPTVTVDRLLNYLTEGHRMDPPEITPDEVYPIMTSCWQWKASQRPSFPLLQNILEQLAYKIALNLKYEDTLHYAPAMLHYEIPLNCSDEFFPLGTESSYLESQPGVQCASYTEVSSGDSIEAQGRYIHMTSDGQTSCEDGSLYPDIGSCSSATAANITDMLYVEPV